MVLLTRKIEFSASHRYPQPESFGRGKPPHFGKCNNPHGHGHNYTLQVTIEGKPDPRYRHVLDLKELKEILEREVMQRMVSPSLNYEVAELAGRFQLREHRPRICNAGAENHARPLCIACGSMSAGPLCIATQRRERGGEVRAVRSKSSWPPLSFLGVAPAAYPAAQ